MPLDNETAAAAEDDGSGSSPTATGDSQTTAERNRGSFHRNYTGNSPRQLPKVQEPQMIFVSLGRQAVVKLGDGYPNNRLSGQVVNQL